MSSLQRGDSTSGAGRDVTAAAAVASAGHEEQDERASAPAQSDVEQGAQKPDSGSATKAAKAATRKKKRPHAEEEDPTPLLDVGHTDHELSRLVEGETIILLFQFVPRSCILTVFPVFVEDGKTNYMRNRRRWGNEATTPPWLKQSIMTRYAEMYAAKARTTCEVCLHYKYENSVAKDVFNMGKKARRSQMV